MDGMHDLGGMQGFGPVKVERNKPIYSYPWEARAHALNILSRKLDVYTVDEYRHAIERMDPRHYLRAPYYERVLTGCVSLWVEKGLVTVEELEKLAGGTFPLALPITPGRGNHPERRSYAVGDRVTVRSEFVSGHHRMPGYVRGKTGVVVGISPAYQFPDADAHMMEADHEPTYDVRFESTDLWPESCESAAVMVGLFESYLQPA